MNLKLKKSYKKICLLGLIFLFASLFFNWYYFQVQDPSQNIIASWYYNIFLDWNTDLSNSFNNSIKLGGLSFRTELLFINILFVIMIIISAYVILFKDIDSDNDLQKLQKFSYVNFALLIFNGFYIFVFPIYYLYSNNMYFPFLVYVDTSINYSYLYCVGEGYILQLIAFFMIFPYSVFYYRTLINFEMEMHSPEKTINGYIKKMNKPLDLETLITKERTKIMLNSEKLIEEKKSRVD